MKCQYCNKDCKNKNSLSNHERLCKNNPNKQHSNLGLFIKKGHKSWNFGLTKENNESILKQSNTYKKRISSGEITTWQNGLTKETDERIKKSSEKIKNTIKNKVQNNEWHKSLSPKKRIKYKDVWLDSKWEFEVANYLDKNNIIWEIPINYFEYEFNNEYHKYYPDFYLPQYDKYIEVKGYEREKDLVKYTTIKDLIIIKSKEIKNIQKNIFNIFEYF